MKKYGKVMLCAFSLFLLTSCFGEKYTISSRMDKIEVVLSIVEKKDEKVKEDLKKNIDLLRKAIEKKDEKAKEELNEWQAIMFIYGVEL